MESSNVARRECDILLEEKKFINTIMKYEHNIEDCLDPWYDELNRMLSEVKIQRNQ
jgi:hypothetical protein